MSIYMECLINDCGCIFKENEAEEVCIDEGSTHYPREFALKCPDCGRLGESEEVFLCHAENCMIPSIKGGDYCPDCTVDRTESIMEDR